MKRFVGIVLLIVLQLGIAAGWMAYGAGERKSGEAQVWVKDAYLSPEEKQMQENLARWYNLNLSEAGEGRPLEGYENILYLEDGLMCWVTFSRRQQTFPVWHGVRGAQDCGLNHLSRSAFPIGGRGNHTVLTGGADVLDSKELPERGEQFVMNILGEAKIYRIFEVRVTKREPSLPEMDKERDLCSIWIRRDSDWVIIRAAREENRT